LAEITEGRTQVTGRQVNDAFKIMHSKLNYRLKQKGNGIYVSSHETLGILEEEFLELKEAVKNNNFIEIEDELLDVAVGAIFGFISSQTGSQDWPRQK